MNILFMAPNVCIDGSGGDVTHVTELTSNLTNLNNQVILIARNKKNKAISLPCDFKNAGLISQGKFWIPFTMITAFFLGFYILTSKKIDLIYERHHVFGVGIILGKIFKTPVVVEVNGITAEEISSSYFSNKILLIFIHKMERFLFTHADSIVTVSVNIKNYLSNSYGIAANKICVVSNGVNIDLFKPITDSKKILNLEDDYYYVLFVGNLAKWQDVETLIKAAPLVLSKIPQTRFLIVGEGVMKNKLMELVRNTGVENFFIFTGVVKYEKVPLYINASDVCIAPFLKSRKCSPLKIYEYMACQKPFVSSGIEDVMDALKEANAGIFVEPENPHELSEAIIKILNDKVLKFKLSDNGRSYVLNNQSWRAVSDRILSLCFESTRINH